MNLLCRDLVDIFYGNPLVVPHFVRDPKMSSGSHKSGLDYVDGDIDLEVMEVTACVISPAKAYSNLGDVLAAQKECQINCFIRSLGVMSEGVSTNKKARVYSEFYNPSMNPNNVSMSIRGRGFRFSEPFFPHFRGFLHTKWVVVKG